MRSDWLQNVRVERLRKVDVREDNCRLFEINYYPKGKFTMSEGSSMWSESAVMMPLHGIVLTLSDDERLSRKRCAFLCYGRMNILWSTQICHFN